MIWLETPKPLSDGLKLKEDKTLSSKEVQISQSSQTSKGPSLNLKMNFSQEAKIL